MAESLKDQLLKAGLVSKHQVRSADAAKRKGKADDGGSAEAARRAQAEKAERDRELNRKRQEDEARKANAAAIRQLIETNRIGRTNGDVPYNFVEGNKIKRIYLTPELHARLSGGSLCIAKLDGRHELVTPDVAEKIRARDPARVIFIPQGQVEQPAGDDPYAAFQVPDDLIW